MTEPVTDRGTTVRNPASAAADDGMASTATAAAPARTPAAEVASSTANVAVVDVAAAGRARQIVLRWVAEVLERDTEELRPEQDLTDELGATSVERLDIIVAVERELGIEFTGASLGDIRRLEDLIQLTARHIGE